MKCSLFKGRFMKEINFKIEIKSYLNNFGKNFAHKALLPNALRNVSLRKDENMCKLW